MVQVNSIHMLAELATLGDQLCQAQLLVSFVRANGRVRKGRVSSHNTSFTAALHGLGRVRQDLEFRFFVSHVLALLWERFRKI